MKTCEWCGAEFEATHEEQAYCKTTHAKRANRKRHKEREALQNAGKCPTPYKRSWSSPEQAQLFKLPANQYLYKCRCGAIHSATDKKAAAA